MEDPYLNGFPVHSSVVGFDRDLTEAHKAALRLHVCGTAYDFSDAQAYYPHDYGWT